MSTEGSGASRGAGDGIHNEDAFLVQDELGLYLVCDGASQSAAGEVAARIARDAVAATIQAAETDLDVQGRGARALVEEAMAQATRAVAAAARTDPELRDSATTMTVLLAHGRLGVIGHCGDSRAYLLRRGRSQQLTVDHELAERVPSESTQAGAFDVFSVELRGGDTVVLCTDGAEKVVEDDTISQVAAGLSPRLLSSRIVSAARRRDPCMDATAVVVRVCAEREAGWFELSELPQPTAFGHTLRRPVPPPAPRKSERSRRPRPR